MTLLGETNMIDFAIDKYESAGEDVPESVRERREEVLKRLQSMRERVMPLLLILEDDEKVRMIPSFKSVEDMCEEFDLPTSVVEELAEYAKVQFDGGDYP